MAAQNNGGWDGDDRRRGQWTMVREIIGTIVGVMPFVVGMFVWGLRIDARVAQTEVLITALQKEDTRQEVIRSERASELDKRMERVEVKIDKLLDNRR